MPAAPVILIVTMLCMIFFYATSFDSIAYTAACYSYKSLGENEKPHTMITLLWCLLLIVLPIALVFSESSMNNIQSVSIISAFPIGIIMILMIWSFLKDAKKYREEKGLDKDWDICYKCLKGSTKKTNDIRIVCARSTWRFGPRIATVKLKKGNSLRFWHSYGLRLLSTRPWAFRRGGFSWEWQGYQYRRESSGALEQLRCDRPLFLSDGCERKNQSGEALGSRRTWDHHAE